MKEKISKIVEKRIIMKRIIALLVVLAFFSFEKANAQCTNTSAYGTATATTNGTTVTISTCNYQSEYSTVNSIVGGQTYVANYSLGGCITVHSGSSNGPVVAWGNAPLTWTAPSSGTYYLHYNTNCNSCATLTNCGTSTIVCTSCLVGGTCSDGIQNQGETGIDCGGPCPPCTNIPITAGNQTVCGGTFTDSGGSGGAYTNSEDYTITFTPNSPCNYLQFVFSSFATESVTFDWLSIYNGPNTSSPLIGTYGGTNSPGTVTATNASGALTFVWHSDGSVTAAGWVAAISCIPGTQCSGTPSVATAVATPGTLNCSVTSTVLSATNLASNCGITYQWQSAPAPGGPWTNIPGATNATYTASPTSNTYYRVITTCTNSGLTSTSSSVQVISSFGPPPNDNCNTATPVTVNSNLNCTSTTYGTIACASASPQASGCGGTANDDVWFSFVATSTTHTIDLLNITGSTTDLYHAVYTGNNCNSLGAPIICSDPNNSTLNGLTVGTTYYIRVYSWSSAAGATSAFNLCVGTPVPPPPCSGTSPAANDNCATPTPICEFEGYCGNTSSTYTPGSIPPSFCGSVENNSWLSFTASATTANLNVFVSNCTNGWGIQMEIYSTTNCVAFTSYSNCWNPGIQTNGVITATGLTPGNTYLLMIDGNAGDVCDYVISAGSGVFTANAIITQTGTTTATICAGQTVNLLASGGTSYSWTPTTGLSNPNIANPTATVTTTTTYNCNITGGNPLCPSTQAVQVTVTVSPGLTVTTAQTNPSCNGGNNGTASVTSATGGTTPYSYVWSGGLGTNQSVTGLSAGTYYVTTSSPNGCSYVSTITIANPPVIVLTTSSTPATCGLTNGSATVTVSSGGVGPWDYLWSTGASIINSASTSNTLSGVGAGSYSVTVTDANGCTAVTSVNVTSTAGVTSTFTQSANQCLAGNSFSFSNTGSSGGGYSYSWTFPSGTPATSTQNNPNNISWSTPGTYTVTHTVTGPGPCTSTTTSNVIIYPPPAVTIAQTNVTCNGLCNGTATASPSGAGYSYVWNDPAPVQTTQTATALCAGTYNVTVTNSNGCTGVGTVNIAQPANMVLSASRTNVTCNGLCNGTANVVVSSGGTAPFSYAWGAGATPNAATTTGLCQGTYTVTVTDANGCTATATVTISQPALLTSSITAQTNISCNGGANGSATVTAAGGTAGYTYLWNDPAPAQTTATATALTVGSWTVTVTDANGCTSTSTVNITQPTLVTASISAQTNVSCNGGANGSATVSAGGGTAPYSYLWNDPAPAQTTATATALTVGSWTVTVTDALGCTATTTVNITQPTALTGAIVGTNPGCNGAITGSANLTASGGTSPYTYLWSNGATSEDLSGVAAGTYTVTITSVGGCTTTASVTITAPTAVTAAITAQTNVGCNGGATGSATVTAGGGTPGYTYLWNDPAPAQTTATSTALTVGTWTVTVTDANGCTATTTVNITQPTLLTSSITAQTNISCNGGANGSATVTAAGGTAGYTYLWNDPAPAQTTATATALTVGSWTVTVTDANGCTSTSTVNITQPTLVTASISAQTNVSCNGGANGSATVSAGGGTAPYSYLWNDPAPAQTTATATALTVGSWTVTVTDALGCTAITTVNITQPTALTGAIVGTNPGCNGATTGSANLTASGGTSPYTYLWSNGATSEDLSGVAAGTYTVTITSVGGCTTTASVTITAPSAVTAVITAQTNVGCNGGATGSATVTAGGGTPGYTYLWNDPAPAQTTATSTALTVGTWTVTVTDANGCTATTTVNITQPTLLTSSITAQTNISCNGGANGSATVSAGGGTAPYSYLWNDPAPAQTTATATALTVGSWTVTVTDALGCTATTTVNITQPVVLTTITTGTPALCNGSSDGTATTTPSGGTSPYTYIWQNLQTTQTATGLVIGTYGVTVTDANGCSVVSSYTVTEPTAIVITPTPVDATCGMANGSASVAVSGGTSPYTYLWSTGGATNGISGVIAGAYIVTVTDANNCTSSTTININNSGAPTANITAQTNVSCNGGSNGSATVTAAGGTPGYNYIWNDPAPAQTTATATGLSAGTWTVTVTDVMGCIATATVIITEPTVLSSSITAQTNVSCNAGSNGSGTVSVSGGTAPYTYLWNDPAPAQTTATATALTVGSWSVTVTDALGCTTISNVVITEPTALISSITAQTNIGCNGGSNGSATVTANGGTSPYNYLWNDPAPAQTTPTSTGLTVGSWTVTVTDANGCTSTSTVVITEPILLTAAITAQTNIGCNGGSNGSATVTASDGTSPYSYLWNNPAPAQTTATATGLTAGTWTVTVTDINNCTAVTSVIITEPTILTASITAQTNVSCNGGSNGSATVTEAGGTPGFTYLWNDPAPAQTTATATGLTVGTWSVTVTDANGCTISTTVSITEPPLNTASIASQTNVSCSGGSDGSATVASGGGTAPYSYLWNDPAPAQTTATATALTVGSWTVTVTDALGCTTSATVIITEPTLLTASATGTDVLCNGGATGSSDLSVSGGTAGYNYNWSNSSTTEDQTGLSAGTYDVTVTDANGCTTTTSVTINEPLVVVATITSSTNTTGFGLCDGTATVSGSDGTPGYTYNWSNSSTTASITGLCAGTYSVTVTDANGCTAVTTVTIVEPNAVVPVITATTNVNCNGVCIGTATVSTSGGVPPYSYLWPNTQTTLTATGLCAGSYIVTVTDSNGVTGTATATITEPPALTSSIGSQTNVSCNGGSDGSATVASGGGTAPYSYLWNDGSSQTTSTATGLSAGSWTVTVTDALGCTAVSTVTITEPILLTANIAGTNVLCNGATTGSADLTVIGGSPSYTFLWTTTATSEDLTGIAAGTYSVTVTDALGCTAIANINITEPTAVTASAVAIDAHCGQSDGSATVTAGGGTPTYTYLWSNGQTTSTATGLIAGSYSVTVIDINGCIQTTSASVNNLSGGVASITSSNPASCNGSSDGAATATMTGAVTYLWDNGETTATAVNLDAGIHYVTVTDNNGCSSVANTTITEPTPVASTVTGVDALCSGSSNGSADLTPSGGTPLYTYLWSNGATTEDLTGVLANIYTVTITDQNSCTSTNSITINEPTLLTSSITASTNVSCSGGTNGTATVTASGGTPAYSYLWDGGTSPTLADNVGISAGNYNVTVTDANGCTSISTIAITEPTPISLTMSAINENCGQANGSATVVAAGGTITTGYTYLWDGGASPTQSTTTDLSFGTYSVTVTDNNGCTAVGTVNVTNIAPGTATISSQSDVSCYGICDGSATVSVGGGIAPFTYLWSNGQTTVTATGLCAGSYTVTTTDANSCNLTASVTIAEPAVLSNVSTVTSPTCFGDCDGVITTLVSGGTAPYTYQWDDPSLQTGSNANGLCVGTYSVTVLDANNCIYIESNNVDQPPQITTAAVATDAHCNQADGALNLTVTNGALPLTFSWSNGATSEDLTGISAGSYSVTVTDFKGCTGTGNFSVNDLTGPVASIQSSTNVSCFGQCNGVATVTATGGGTPYTYLWDNGQTSQTGTALCAGNHNVTVTGSYGCIATTSIMITEPLQLNSSATFVAPLCNNACNGTATVLVAGGTTPYTYSWTNSNTTPTATGLCAGSYTVIVTDANACTSSNTVNVTQPAFIAITATTTPVQCYNACNGTATASTIGGTLPYTYLWSDPAGQTTATATGLCAGTFTVTVTDANLCAQTYTVTITQPSALTSTTLNQVNVSCFGMNNGSLQANGSGGSPTYSYQWSGGQNSQSISNLLAGVYTVTVTDQNGCTSVSQATITQPTDLTLSLSPTNESCYNACNGSINANPNGGVTPYTFVWSTAQSTINVTNLCQGSYQLTVTDANGCTETSSTIITGPTQMTVVVTSSVNADCGQPTGSGSVAVSGGTGSSYTYTWNPNVSNSNSLNNVIAGAYTVTVTDANGCTASVTVNINDNNAPIITNISVTNVSCNGGNNGTATVTYTSSTGTNNIVWSDPMAQTTNTAIGLTSGSYYVVVTDANGCTASGNTTIGQPQVLNAQVSSTTPALCNGSCDGTANVIVVGGTIPYSYLWSGNAQTTPQATGLCPGVVTVLITDANGCTATAGSNISQPSPILVTGTTTPVNCYGGNDGIISASASGGSPGYSYSWLPYGGNTSVAANLTANTSFTVTVTDINGCTAQASFVLQEPSQLLVQTTTQPSTCNLDNGIATATASGGTPGYIYFWSPSGDITNTADNLAPGNHLITVIDSHNCISTATATVNALPPPELINIIVTNTSCYGASDGTIQAQVINGGAPYSYIWTPLGGSDSIATHLSAGTYYLTVVDIYGCEALTPPIIVNQPTPVVVFANGSDTICLGSSITISASANGGTPGYTYQWNDSTWNTQSHTVSPLQTTTYTVTATDANGCTSSAPGFVTVYVSPPLNVILPPDVDICAGQSYSINAIASGGNGGPYIYNWNIGGGNPNVVSPYATTTYIVTVQDVCNTPPAHDTIVVNVHPIPQVISPPLSASGCTPVTVVFNNVVNGFGPVTYAWNFGDPTSNSNTSSDSIPVHIYEGVGTYNVNLVLTTAYGCNSTVTYNNLVTVTPAPVAGFTFYPDGVSVFDANIQFYDQSSDAAYWNWDFGDGGYATVTNPLHQYYSADTFLVTLSVRGLNGCVDTTSAWVTIFGEISFYAPTAFAPDGLSGYFYPKGMGFDKKYYELSIFDRWGQTIYETNQYPEGTENTQVMEGGWNGRYKNEGAIVPVGVYTWLVKYKDIRGITHEYVGSVTVVR